MIEISMERIPEMMPDKKKVRIVSNVIEDMDYDDYKELFIKKTRDLQDTKDSIRVGKAELLRLDVELDKDPEMFRFIKKYKDKIISYMTREKIMNDVKDLEKSLVNLEKEYKQLAPIINKIKQNV